MHLPPTTDTNCSTSSSSSVKDYNCIIASQSAQTYGGDSGSVSGCFSQASRSAAGRQAFSELARPVSGYAGYEMSMPGGRSRSGPGPGLVVVAGRGPSGSGGDSGFFLRHSLRLTERRPARLTRDLRIPPLSPCCRLTAGYVGHIPCCCMLWWSGVVWVWTDTARPGAALRGAGSVSTGLAGCGTVPASRLATPSDDGPRTCSVALVPLCQYVRERVGRM